MLARLVLYLFGDAAQAALVAENDRLSAERADLAEALTAKEQQLADAEHAASMARWSGAEAYQRWQAALRQTRARASEMWRKSLN